MTLPASGTLSLNAIHIEAGGSSGTSCSINDSDIRNLIGKGSGASMNFAEWYGASSFTPDTQMVITGANSGVKFAQPSFSTYSSGIVAGTLGSASDRSITLDQGQTVYFHSVFVSALTSISMVLDLNASTAATGGGLSRTDYLTGHYWRTSLGNQLLGATAARSTPNPAFTGQRFNNQNVAFRALGSTFNVAVTIQVY